MRVAIPALLFIQLPPVSMLHADHPMVDQGFERASSLSFFLLLLFPLVLEECRTWTG